MHARRHAPTGEHLHYNNQKVTMPSPIRGPLSWPPPMDTGKEPEEIRLATLGLAGEDGGLTPSPPRHSLQ